MRRWAYRFVRTHQQRDLEFIIAGRRGRIMWTPLFDRRGGGSRAVFSASIDLAAYHYGVLLQHYREGYDFDEHLDGVPENKVLSLLLHRPSEGGEFFIDGPERVWLKGRVRTFDGGRHRHGVTKIAKGSRTVLMLQRGRWRL